LETVNANLPRFDFSPSSVGTCNGLLIEEARANLCIHSSNYASWSDSGAGVSNSVVTSPDNATNAKEVTRTSGQADARFQAVTFTGDGVKTASIWVRKSTSPSSVLAIYDATAVAYRLWADLTWSGNTPALSFVGVNGTGSLLASKQFLNDWWQLEFATTAVTAANTNRFYIYPARAGSSNGQGLTCFGVQVENGAFSTSYIPTTSTSLTRNADVVSMTGTNFSDWYNATEGMFIVTASALNLATDRAILQTSTGPNINSGQFLYYNSSGSCFGYRVFDSAATTVGAVNYTSAGTPVINTSYCNAIGYKTNSFIISANGAAVEQDTSGTVSGTPDTLRIGHDTVPSYLNGYIKKLNFYPQRLINAETQAFSKG
jgi:hypothetical protein